MTTVTTDELGRMVEIWGVRNVSAVSFCVHLQAQYMHNRPE